MPCKGRNLPIAPAQIRWPWYLQGPQVSTSLLEIAKPLFLSPQKLEGISTFNERLLQVFPICCYSSAVTTGKWAFLTGHSTPRLDLPPPRAVLAGSPPDRGRAWWEPWDNVRVVRPEHKALFAHRKYLKVLTLLMEVSAVRSAVLADRNFSSTESSSSKGPLWSPARTIERSQEGSLGGFNLLSPLRNLTMRLCFPRDRPSTATGCAVTRSMSSENQVRVGQQRNWQDLFLVLTDLAQCLCEKAYWGKCKLA